MEKFIVKISKKGQIAIPKRIRDKLKTDLLEVEFSGEKIVIKPARSITELGGILKEYSNKVKPGKKKQEDTEAWEKHVQEKFEHN